MSKMSFRNVVAEKRLRACAQRKLRVKALLLDLDGTLVDSSEALMEAGRAGFRALGLPDVHDRKIPFDVARRLEQDLPIDDLFSKLQISKEIEEKFLPAYLTAYYSAVASKSKILPRVKKALESLSQRLPLALITLRYVAREQVLDELDNLGLEVYFRVVVTTLEVERPKPFPDALMAAAERLCMPISECAIVGDSVIDIQAGKAAGAKTIAVLTGLFSRTELEAHKPDLIIESVASLPEHISEG